MALEFSDRIFLPLGEDPIYGDVASWHDPNGRNLSQRLWLAKDADRRAIDRILIESVAAGDDPIRTAKRLEDYLTPVGRQATTRTPRGGMGNYAARRLARTETTRAFGQATIDAAERNPFVEGVKWNISGSHPKPDACDRHARGHSRGMEPGVYAPRDVPTYPEHPQCLCFLSPVTMRDTADIVAQLRRDFGLDPQPIRLFGLPRPSRARELVTALFRIGRALLNREAA